jgi:hypothetical protein
MDSTEVKTVADFLVADFEREMQTTLRILEAVPHGRLDYQPDAKAKTGLGLIRHIALEDSWLLNGIADGTFTPPPDDSERELRRTLSISATSDSSTGAT